MIGNDIVDLSDPESACESHHARFDRRVFTPEEIRWLSIDHSGAGGPWILWSAKEAAYKAARRDAADVVFSPTRFTVELDRSLCGSVRHGNRRWPVRVQIDGACVHAVVSDESFRGTLSGSCRLTGAGLRDPSEGVRRFAISTIAEQLGVAVSELRIEKVDRIPRLIWVRRVAPVALSLSHHGSFAGFACRDPQTDETERMRRRAADRGVTIPRDVSSCEGSFFEQGGFR
jgi:hypothetical protein